MEINCLANFDSSAYINVQTIDSKDFNKPEIIEALGYCIKEIDFQNNIKGQFKYIIFEHGISIPNRWGNCVLDEPIIERVYEKVDKAKYIEQAIQETTRDYIEAVTSVRYR